MNEIEKIEYAKLFIDKLANGINPLNDEQIPDDDIVNNVRLSRCFFYVSSILEEVIRKGGFNKRHRRKEKEPFTITYEERSKFKYSQEPLTRTQIAEQLNILGFKEDSQKFSIKRLTNWLSLKGFIGEFEDPQGKKIKIATKEGNEAGITLVERNGKYGVYELLVFDINAQHFIIDNIDDILSYE